MPGLLTSPAGKRPEVLLAVAQAVAAHADLGALLRDLAAALWGHLPPGYLSFALIEPDHRSAKLQFLEPVGGVARAGPRRHADRTSRRRSRRPRSSGARRSRSGSTSTARTSASRCCGRRTPRQGVRAACFVPLTTPRRKLGAMGFTSYAPVAPAAGDVEFAAQVGRLVALAVEAALTRQELQRANDRLAAEKLYLEEEIRTERRMDEIVGDGPALRGGAAPGRGGRADRLGRAHHRRDRAPARS